MKWRSDLYLKWVRSKPCMITGEPTSDAHHAKCRGLGMGTKCHDLFTIPLTRLRHSERHSMARSDWEERYGNEAEMVLQMINQALEEGVIQIQFREEL